jgi:hypothetical protein
MKPHREPAPTAADYSGNGSRTLVCTECCRHWLDCCERWRLLVSFAHGRGRVRAYCPACADREFGV